MNILYVEDHYPDFLLLEVENQHNTQYSNQLFWAESIEKALEKLAELAIDLVFLDLSLPDAKGLTGLRELICKYDHLPIIVLTGSQDAELGVAAIKEGAQDFLNKNAIDLYSLYKAAEYALERSKINFQLKEAISRVERLNNQFQLINDELSKANLDLIDERRKAFQQRERMREFSRLLSTNIRQPLTLIHSYLQLVGAEDSGLTAKQKKYIMEAEDQAEGINSQLLTLINTTIVNDGDLKNVLVRESILPWLRKTSDLLMLELIKTGARYAVTLPDADVDVVLEPHALDSIQEQMVGLLVGMVDEQSTVHAGYEETDAQLTLNVQVQRTYYHSSYSSENSYDPLNDGLQPFRLNLLEQLMAALQGDVHVKQSSNAMNREIYIGLLFTKMLS